MSFKRFASPLLPACLCAFVILLSACGGSSSSSTAATTDCTLPSLSDQNGCAYANLADATGDFLSYTVSVTALTLTRADGTVVNLLPNTTTVDFAQYSDLSEFLMLASMPQGTYTDGSITLDYTNADIQVADSSGNAVQIKPVDAGGNAITTLTLSIKLDDQGALVLVPGVPRVFQVDFDLAASNTVNFTSGEPSTVTVQPFLVATVDPDLTNLVQVRGPLATVDTTNGDFTLALRPFYAISGSYGNLRVFTNGNTVYDINQAGYTGSAGLTALASAGATTAVIAKGNFDFASHEFIATEVDAGSSVPGGTLDAADGVVLNRSGNLVTLRGATLYRAGQTAIFRDSVAVTLGANTKVREAGSPKAGFAISDISVGQRLLVFGTLTNTNPSMLALDARNGFARLQYTKFDGHVTSAPTAGTSGGAMAVNVQFIEGRPVSMFNFAGTGTSGATDANPSSYQIALASVLSGIGVNDPVRVWGFVTPFGSAPPDFSSTAVADYVNANALLAMAWASPGTSSAFTSMGNTSGLVLNLASTPTPLLADLVQGGITTQLTSLTNGAPTVQGNALGVGTCTINMPRCAFGMYAILQNGTVQLHIRFTDFLSDVIARLNAGGKVRGFYARGGFAGSTDTMQANEITVVIQ